MIHTLKDKVLFVLDNYPQTRNCDIELTIRLLKTYYADKLSHNGDYLFLGNLYQLPREDSIKRIRASIQNDYGYFLPTSWEVAKKRKINELVWKTALGYHIPNPNQNNLF